MTPYERQEPERQQAHRDRLLAQVVGRPEYQQPWAEAREMMAWDSRPVFWQLEALIRWIPLHVIQRLPGDDEAELLEGAGAAFCAWRDGQTEAASARSMAAGARAADRGARLLRRLGRGVAGAGQSGG